jgi:type II secretory pathway predicted ATPase ExeA
LSGQPEFELTLRQPSLRQLRQRVAMWCRTQALSLEQTGAYIHQRLLIAGASDPIFTDEAVEAVYSASRGIPRLINLVCEHALIFGYVEQMQRIPPGIVYAVAQDLDLETQPFLVAQGQNGFSHNE